MVPSHTKSHYTNRMDALWNILKLLLGKHEVSWRELQLLIALNMPVCLQAPDVLRLIKSSDARTQLGSTAAPLMAISFSSIPQLLSILLDCFIFHLFAVCFFLLQCSLSSFTDLRRKTTKISETQLLKSPSSPTFYSLLPHIVVCWVSPVLRLKSARGSAYFP